jgi:hypothetical protein
MATGWGLIHARTNFGLAPTKQGGTLLTPDRNYLGVNLK